MEQLVTARKAARILGIPNSTFARWIAEQRLAVRAEQAADGTWRIPAAEVERLAIARAQAAEAVTLTRGAALALNTWWRQRYAAAVTELVEAARALVTHADSGDQTSPDRSAAWPTRIQAVAVALQKAQYAAGIATPALEIAAEASRLEREARQADT